MAKALWHGSRERHGGAHRALYSSFDMAKGANKGADTKKGAKGNAKAEDSGDKSKVRGRSHSTVCVSGKPCGARWVMTDI